MKDNNSINLDIVWFKLKDRDGKIFETFIGIFKELDKDQQLMWIEQEAYEILEEKVIDTVPSELEQYYLMYYALLKNINKEKLSVFVRNREKFTTLAVYPYMIALTERKLLTEEQANNINYLLYKHIRNNSPEMLENDFVAKYDKDYKWISHREETLEPEYVVSRGRDLENKVQGIYKMKVIYKKDIEDKKPDKDGNYGDDVKVDIYIGQSNDIKRRMNEHATKKFKNYLVTEIAIMKTVKERRMLNYWELYFLKEITGWENNNYSQEERKNIETVSIKRYLQPKPEMSALVGEEMNNRFFKLWYNNFIFKATK